MDRTEIFIGAKFQALCIASYCVESFNNIWPYCKFNYSQICITHQARNFLASWVKPNFAKFAQKSWLDELCIPDCIYLTHGQPILKRSRFCQFIDNHLYFCTVCNLITDTLQFINAPLQWGDNIVSYFTIKYMIGIAQ